MSNAVEEFLIRFKFDNKKIVQDLKKVAKAYDQLEAGAKRSKAVEATKRQTQEQRKLNAQMSEAIRLNRSLNRFTSLKSFQDVKRADPTRARILRANYIRTMTSGGTEESITNNLAKQRQNLVGVERGYRKATVAARKLNTVQKGLTDSTRNMVRAYASIFAVVGATAAINKTGQSFEAMNSAMLAAMGSEAEAAKQVEFLTGMTRRLGFSLLDTADQYTKFVFASKDKLDTEQVNTFFQSMAEAGTVLGVSKDRMRLSFNAVQQMMNKTTVNSEELRRQLAESFPGAVQLFAKAAGKTEKELFDMMQAGKLLAADILPLVGEEMKKLANTAGALEAKLMTTRIAQGRFFNELELSMNKIFKSGFDKGFAELLETFTVGLNNNQEVLEALGKTFGFVFKIIKAIAEPLLAVIGAITFVTGKLAEAMDSIPFSENVVGYGVLAAGIYKVVAALNVVKKAGWAAILPLSLPFLTIAAVVSAAILALQEFYSLFDDNLTGVFEKYVLGKETGETSWGKEIIKGISAVVNFFDRIVNKAIALYNSIAGDNSKELATPTRLQQYADESKFHGGASNLSSPSDLATYAATSSAHNKSSVVIAPVFDIKTSPEATKEEAAREISEMMTEKMGEMFSSQNLFNAVGGQ